MKTNKLLIVFTVIIILAIFAILSINYKGVGASLSVPQKIAQIRSNYTAQLDLSNKIGMLLGSLRLTLYSPGQKINQAKVTKILDKLNPLLSQASQKFGLTVKRWALLFKIWQINSLPKLLSMQKRPSVMDFDFQAFVSQIQSSINDAKKDFKLMAFEQIIYYPYPKGYNPNSKVYLKIRGIYNKEAKKLIPDVRKKLETGASESPLSCVGAPYFKLNATNVAASIAWFQYFSRYCPFMVKNKIKMPCNTLKNNFPTLDKAAKLRFEKGLAYCRIAGNRLAQEAKEAKAKYGQLSFEEYYKRYIKPLVPEYIKKLKRLASKNNYHACNPEMLPVVSFRDPKVDAYSAAYEMIGPEICQPYALSNNDFISLRATAYRALHSKEKQASE